MNIYETMAEQVLSMIDQRRHVPMEPVSGAMRGEMAVLRLLSGESSPVSAGMIAAELKMKTSRVAAVLNSLEKKQMIIRTADPDDKRRVVVIMTDKGRAYSLERRKEAKAHLSGLMERLGEEDAAAFIRICGKIMNMPVNRPSDEEK